MIFKDWDLGFENNFLLSSLLYAFVLSFRMQMNFGEDGMEFSDPSDIDIMHNIDVSKFMEEFMQGSGGNPMWRKNKREDIYHPLRLLVYWLWNLFKKAENKVSNSKSDWGDLCP